MTQPHLAYIWFINPFKKKPFSLSIISMFLLVGLIAMVIALNVNFADGFFHDPKPEKPSLGIIQNPDIIAEFDKLYDKYPNINQADVDQLGVSATNLCFLGAHQEVRESNPESDNMFGQMVGNAMCSGIISGTIENYLNDLGIAFISNGGGQTPTLIQ